jgi:general secretion pathway protein D
VTRCCRFSGLSLASLSRVLMLVLLALPAFAPVAFAQVPDRMPDARIEVASTPSVPSSAMTSMVADPLDALAAGLQGEAIVLHVDASALPDFIADVLGRLKLDFVLGPGIRERRDPVTLRIVGAVTPAQLLRITRRALLDLGVSMTLQSGTLLIARDAGNGAGLPLYVPDGKVPVQAGDARRVIVAVQLQSVRYTAITPWLSQAFGNAGVSVDQEPVSNTLLVSGPAAAVGEAIRAVEVLDRPRQRAARTLLLKPREVAVDQLARDLLNILQSEGIAADLPALEASVVLLPLTSEKALAVFAPDQRMLDHIAEWARALDRPPLAAVQTAIFSYPLQYLSASAVVDTLSELSPPARAMNPASAVVPVEATETEQEGEPAQSWSKPPVAPASPGHLAVDANRNAVVFRGAPEEWSLLYRAIREMDRPTTQVLVEMLLAEVSLDDQYASGVEWLASGSVNGEDISYGTVGGLGLGDAGFNLRLQDGETVRALINLFATDGAVRIRSRPSLVVASGHTARLDVGDQIPVVSASSRSVEQSDAPVIRTVEYRRTGLLLEILPTVKAGGQLDIELSQTLSEALRTTTSAIDSPTIRSRSLHTTVSLKDGGAVLLGGLLAVSDSTNETGVPGRGRLPLAGKLLGADARNGARTELLLLIRPRLLRAGDTASASPQGLP